MTGTGVTGQPHRHALIRRRSVDLMRTCTACCQPRRRDRY
jgi:hypothetical protein